MITPMPIGVPEICLMFYGHRGTRNNCGMAIDVPYHLLLLFSLVRWLNLSLELSRRGYQASNSETTQFSLTGYQFTDEGK